LLKQIVKKEKSNLCLNVKSFLVFYAFLCTLQRREISLIFAKARHLATKFCTKPYKTEKTPRSLAVLVLIVENNSNELKMMEIVMVFDNKNVVFVSVR
jgi:hypothetical protein